METQPKATHPKFVRWALMIGIIVILNIFFSVVLALAYPAPQYSDYCPNTAPSPVDAKSCDAQGGVWTEYPTAPNQDLSNPKSEGYCDMYAKCQPPYEAANDAHALRAFLLMTAFGIIALVLGLMPLGSSIVSTGLSYGGVVALVIASGSYWGTAGNWLRLGIATFGLVALLYIGWKRFKD